MPNPRQLKCHPQRRYAAALDAWDKAIKLFEGLAEKQELDASLNLDYLNLLFELSLLLSTSPDESIRSPDRALKLSERIAARNPGGFESDLVRGAALVAAGRNAEAIAALERVPYESGFGFARGFLLAIAFVREGRLDHATQQYERANQWASSSQDMLSHGNLREIFERIRALADTAIKTARP
jgi:tetratricopeptide (TPR) repeat protein